MSNNLNRLIEQEKYDEALSFVKSLLQQSPNIASLHIFHAYILHQLYDDEGAETTLQQARKKFADNNDISLHLFKLYFTSKQYKKFIKLAEKFIVKGDEALPFHENDYINFLYQYLFCLIHLDDYHGDYFKKLLKTFFSYEIKACDYAFQLSFQAPGHFMGSEYMEEIYLFCVKYNPKHPFAVTNYANFLQGQERFSEAVYYYELAIKNDSKDYISRFNYALFLLLSGKYELGWQQYESRWHTRDFIDYKRNFDIPTWQGEDLQGKKILIYAEQGVGDQVLFFSLIPRLYELYHQNLDIILSCDPRIEKNLKLSLPFVEILPLAELREQQVLQEKNIHPDYVLAAGSLPLRLGLFCRHSHFRPAVYLKANMSLSDEIRKLLHAKFPQQYFVGISWYSKGRTKGKYNIDLDDFRLLADRRITLINLQYGDVTADIKAFFQKYKIPIYTIDDIDNFVNLPHLFDLIMAMDEVVSISNSTINFASMLGKKSHLIAPRISTWRWGLPPDHIYSWSDFTEIYFKEKDHSSIRALQKIANKLKESAKNKLG